jgi:hypothetical protein
MSLPVTTSGISGHVRFDSRETVADALLRMGVAFGAPVEVWPPRKLPFGLFLSPVRMSWVSVWSPLENMREWFPRLCATLECPGVLLQVAESQFWIAEFFQGNEFLGRLELPTEAVEWDDLWARTVDSFEAEGVPESWDDEARFGARMDAIAASEEYQRDLRQLREERPERSVLRPFLPPHASLEQAWELLTAIDHGDEEDEEATPYAEDYMEAFASYLGIRDAAWEPGADADALAEGDYEEGEGLPEGWRDFIVLPVTHLPVL